MMNPECEKLYNIVVVAGGKAIGHIDAISATVALPETHITEDTFFSQKDFHGTFDFDIVYIDPKFASLLEYQKAILRMEKEHAKRMQNLYNQEEPKKPDMRKDINSFLKRGKKW